MNNKDILKMLGSCPLREENPELMKVVERHFEVEMKKREIEEQRTLSCNEPDEFVSRKEFKYEINRLHGIIESLLYFDGNESSENIVYHPSTSSDTGYMQVKGDIITA